MTLEEAQALPEIESEMFEHKTIIRDDGTSIQCVRIRPFVAHAFDDDDIFCFRDKDDRLMKIAYTEDGPAKTEVRI